MGHRQTAFSDVCGTIDEFRRLLVGAQERQTASPQGSTEDLLADAVFMLERMAQRTVEYEVFGDGLRKILGRMDAVGAVDCAPAKEAVAVLRAGGAPRESHGGVDVEAMCELAERVRDVANAQEHVLRTLKGLALEVHELFAQAKGDRPWLLAGDGASSLVGRLARKHQAWLPPEPHRGILLDWLSRARIHVVEEEAWGCEPVVQFEDGGCMAMSQVRWDAAVENFRPASPTVTE